jgi:hypothetical protein
MWIGLLWIFGCYGLSIAILHLCFSTRLNNAPKATRVLVITRNNQTQIEWYIRSMLFFSRLRGRHLIVMILDEGSTDETMQIIERLSRMMNLAISNSGESLEELLSIYENEPLILVNLSNKQEESKFSLLIK